MFSVYGTSGRIHVGTLEQVRDLAPVQAVARSRAVEPVSAQALEMAPSTVAVFGQGGHSGQTGFGGLDAPQSYAAHEALAAYGQDKARQPLTRVGQLMSRRLISLRGDATLHEAWGLLARESVGQAPVLGARGEVMGLISRADLLRTLPADLGQVADLAARLSVPVRDVMWTPVPVAQADTPVREAAQLMLELGLPGLPVGDEQGQMIGFLSRTDLLRALTHEPPLDLWS